MWHWLRIGAAILAVLGLTMGGVAAAQAVDEPKTVESGGEQVIWDALAPLLEDGTLNQEQAEAVVGQIAPMAARARYVEGTQDLVRHLGRLAGEIAEVLGISGENLREQLEAGLTLADVAEANGSTGEQLVSQVTQHVAAHLAVQVTAGKVDQARADQIVATTGQTLGRLIDVENPFGTVLKERRHQAGRVAALRSAAGLLGMSADELWAQLEEGNSLVQIAETREVTEHELVEAIVAPLAEQLERAVELGRITDERAAEALDQLAQRVVEAINKIPGS